MAIRVFQVKDFDDETRSKGFRYYNDLIRYVKQHVQVDMILDVSNDADDEVFNILTKDHQEIKVIGIPDDDVNIEWC